MHKLRASLIVGLGLAAAFTGASCSCSDSADDGGSTEGGGSGGGGPGTQGNGAGDPASVNSGVTIASTGTACPEEITCESEQAECGQILDGCGATLECGACPDGETCSGTPQVCSVTTCTPLTCETAGAECGQVSDGCGGLTDDCGSCSQPDVCGGGGDGEAGICSVPPWCTGLCLQQVDCPDPNVTTTISGIVHVPGVPGGPAPDPLFDALVYVPNAAVDDFPAGVSCDQCGAEASGDPLVTTRTNAHGEFTLENVPVGDAIPLVIQLGRWRRVVTLDTSVVACVDNPAPDEKTRLPRDQTEGDIPLIAISTGDVDALECVLRKIGVADAEFTNPDGGGRIHLYRGLGAEGQRIDGNTPTEATLLDSADVLHDYDLVLFPCQGDSYPGRATDTRQAALVTYTSAGGRVLATHYSYDWMHDNGPFATVADWDVGDGSLADQDGVIDQSFPKGVIFADWLVHVGASSVNGLMPVVVVRNNVNSVNAALAQLWMSSNNLVNPLHFTFNTPVGAEPTDQCGRALFSDFHIANSDSGGTNFPGACPNINTPMTPQEKLVEFMLFDLSSCVTPDDPVCVPDTCEDLGIECGPAPDGCNEIIQCGECEEGEVCGGGGRPGICGNGSCTPQDCEEQQFECGPATDGCGLVIQCGNCESNEHCEGNVCEDGPA